MRNTFCICLSFVLYTSKLSFRFTERGSVQATSIHSYLEYTQGYNAIYCTSVMYAHACTKQSLLPPLTAVVLASHPPYESLYQVPWQQSPPTTKCHANSHHYNPGVSLPSTMATVPAHPRSLYQLPWLTILVSNESFSGFHTEGGGLKFPPPPGTNFPPRNLKVEYGYYCGTIYLILCVTGHKYASSNVVWKVCTRLCHKQSDRI